MVRAARVEAERESVLRIDIETTPRVALPTTLPAPSGAWQHNSRLRAKCEA